VRVYDPGPRPAMVGGDTAMVPELPLVLTTFCAKALVADATVMEPEKKALER